MKQHHRVLGMLAALSVVTYLDRVCIAVAGPAMQESLHISPKAWGWVTGVFFLSYGLFEIPTGALGDRLGPRRVLTRIVLWWSAFTSLTAFVTTYPLLLFVRFCFGAGEAGAYPNASIVIARWIPGKNRARAWGIVWMTSQIGAALSPVIVVPIQLRYGWRASFMLFGILGVIWAAVWYWWFRDRPHEKASVTDEELREIGAERETTHSGVPWAEALRSPSLWYVTGISMCYVYVFGFFQAWLQTYLVRAHGFTSTALMLSSVPYIVGACANALGGLASDWAAHRFGLRAGRRIVGITGLSVAVVFLVATIFASSGGLALACLSAAYAGILVQQPTTSALSLDVGRRHAGAVFGFANMASQMSSLISSVAFGYIAEYFGNYNAPFVPMVLTLSIGIVLWTRIDAEREIFADSSALDVRPQALGVPTA